MNGRILVVDDEEAIVEFVEINLVRAGYEVIKAFNGNDALHLLKEKSPDLVVLDVMLPDIDGFEVLKSARSISGVPVIMLTARSEDMDKIAGLELGADDYMVKPFNPWELIARIQAIFRRLSPAREAEAQKVAFGDMTIDPLGRKVWKKGNLIELTPREYDLLLLFSGHPGRIFTREEVRKMIWGHEFIEERSIDVHIRRLRDKIEDNPMDPTYILTIWGVGYKSNPRFEEKARK
ncbi:MAG: response regulator transcription factor [Candidatus Eremiobacteraeota bacterium]|nr:response regulator transcription factor [Candidatus Eremiobacteraeota bacterium]